MHNYQLFAALFAQEMEKYYRSFRLELLVDTISEEIGQIKQTSRFLHQYEHILLNLNSLYQTDNLKIRMLRLVTQLDYQDLLGIDQATFALSPNPSAAEMLAYIEIHEQEIRKYIEKKEFGEKLKRRMVVTT
jgi:hypothetical protein